MKRLNHYLTDRQYERLLRLVEESGDSMAHHVRRAVEQYLTATPKEETAPPTAPARPARRQR